MSEPGGNPYYFRDCLIAPPLPHRALAASTLWHIAFVLLVVPFSRYIPAPARVTLPRVEVTWYGPINDLPLLAPRAERTVRRRPAAASKPEEKVPPAQTAADVFHPRQTIVNNPMRPNHPRQTLIQPAAPLAPPTILPNLPNIVAWDTPNEPKAPPIDPAMLALKKPKAAAGVQSKEIAAPEMTDLAVGPIDIAASEARKPALPVEPMQARRVAAKNIAEVAAPEISAAESQGARLIALSATPEPERPPEMPAGNLAAKLVISPDGVGPANRGAQAQADPAPPSAAGSGPAGLTISGRRGPATSIAGAGAGLRVMPGMPARAAAVAPGTPAAPGVAASRAQPASLLDRIQPGMAPEGLLGPKRVYTLRFSMPNLSSATGSWVLSFAELVTLSAGPQPGPDAAAELSGPRALRKVDPKYPPDLRDKHVEGEVILYAVIRASGTVDSIQLVRGIDPTLDRNAMQALAQWQFSPAERRGVPVDIETVVRIPFRATAPAY